MPALNQVVATAKSDPRPAYETFRKELENTKRQAARVRKRANDMKKQGQAYFEAWEAEFEKVASPERRQRFEQRKEELAAQYERIEEYAQQVKADYDAFMQDLNDIQLVLGVDLTAKGIESIADDVTKTTKGAQKINSHIDKYIEILDQVAAELRLSQQ